MQRVALAYSGGLDTSISIHWLKVEKGLQVVAFAANLGQGGDLAPLGERALAAGAEAAHVLDLRETFVREYVFPMLKAHAVYESGYLLNTAIGRPLIGKELVRIAIQENCDAVAHGCTAKGNDQVRFEAAVAALAPQLKVVAPVREWRFKTREQELAYAEEHNIPVTVKRDKLYSIDRNLWGYSIECGALEDPWAEPPADAWQITTSPEQAPDKPTVLEITFEQGVPVALDGQVMNPVELILALNEVGGENGVGRVDMVENRLVGIKSREVYEAPAAAILYEAHRALEDITVSRDVRRTKDVLSQKYAEIIYCGLWFTDLRRALDAFFDRTQEFVSGKLRVRLYKGKCTVLGRQSPHSLYSRGLATYSEGDTFDHESAQGFLSIWNLPIRAEGERRPGEQAEPEA